MPQSTIHYRPMPYYKFMAILRGVLLESFDLQCVLSFSSYSLRSFLATVADTLTFSVEWRNHLGECNDVPDRAT
eukprot:10417992-Karenia_brevis.AAC.1